MESRLYRRVVNLDDFNYELPPERIAAVPNDDREAARLLVFSRKTGNLTHRQVRDLPELLSPGDALVLNNTRVIHARLQGEDSQRRFEVFLLKELATLQWQCLIKPGKHIGVCKELQFADGVSAEIRPGFTAHFHGISPADFLPWVMKTGSPPLPPYIKRAASEGDRERYQTVFAKKLGSVAAPTAGLHFTPGLLERLKEKGIDLHELTLHVGYGTFEPIRHQEITEHRMHSESYSLSAETLTRLQETRRRRGKVICVGTTSLRTLESVSRCGLTGETDLFIYPGYAFEWGDGLLTNFHLPKSSLYVLVAAYIGLENARRCYREAVESGYRFFSYGDAMLIT